MENKRRPAHSGTWHHYSKLILEIKDLHCIILSFLDLRSSHTVRRVSRLWNKNAKDISARQYFDIKEYLIDRIEQPLSSSSKESNNTTDNNKFVVLMQRTYNFMCQKLFNQASIYDQIMAHLKKMSGCKFLVLDLTGDDIHKYTSHTPKTDKKNKCPSKHDIMIAMLTLIFHSFNNLKDVSIKGQQSILSNEIIALLNKIMMKNIDCITRLEIVGDTVTETNQFEESLKQRLWLDYNDQADDDDGDHDEKRNMSLNINSKLHILSLVSINLPIQRGTWLTRLGVNALQALYLDKVLTDITFWELFARNDVTLRHLKQLSLKNTELQLTDTTGYTWMSLRNVFKKIGCKLVSLESMSINVNHDQYTTVLFMELLANAVKTQSWLTGTDFGTTAGNNAKLARFACMHRYFEENCSVTASSQYNTRLSNIDKQDVEQTWDNRDEHSLFYEKLDFDLKDLRICINCISRFLVSRPLFWEELFTQNLATIYVMKAAALCETKWIDYLSQNAKTTENDKVESLYSNLEILHLFSSSYCRFPFRKIFSKNRIVFSRLKWLVLKLRKHREPGMVEMIVILDEFLNNAKKNCVSHHVPFVDIMIQDTNYYDQTLLRPELCGTMLGLLKQWYLYGLINLELSFDDDITKGVQQLLLTFVRGITNDLVQIKNDEFGSSDAWRAIIKHNCAVNGYCEIACPTHFRFVESGASPNNNCGCLLRLQNSRAKSEVLARNH